MLEKDKPIYARRPVVGNKVVPTKPAEKFPQDAIERKQLQHDDEWLFDHKGQPVFVVFLDGERIMGTVGKIRKFTFVLESEDHGSMMIFKVGVKYVSEVK